MQDLDSPAQKSESGTAGGEFAIKSAEGKGDHDSSFMAPVKDRPHGDRPISALCLLKRPTKKEIPSSWFL